MLYPFRKDKSTVLKQYGGGHNLDSLTKTNRSELQSYRYVAFQRAAVSCKQKPDQQEQGIALPGLLSFSFIPFSETP